MPLTFQELKNSVANLEPRTLSCGHKKTGGEGTETLDGNEVCQDCYFDKLGDIIERHPIGRGTSRGDCVIGPDD